MSYKICPNCKRINDENSEVCKYCGLSLKDYKNSTDEIKDNLKNFTDGIVSKIQNKIENEDFTDDIVSKIQNKIENDNLFRTNDIKEMIEKRSTAKKNKDYEEADRIRKELSEKGIELIDTREGTIYKIK